MGETRTRSMRIPDEIWDEIEAYARSKNAKPSHVARAIFADWIENGRKDLLP